MIPTGPGLSGDSTPDIVEIPDGHCVNAAGTAVDDNLQIIRTCVGDMVTIMISGNSFFRSSLFCDTYANC